VRSDPEPQQALGDFYGESAVAEADAHGAIRTDLLEVEGRVSRVCLQKLEAVVGEPLDSVRKLFIPSPERR
jgi:hypothetical protein